MTHESVSGPRPENEGSEIDGSDQQAAPGEQVRAAIARILRWSSRGDVRRALAGNGGTLSPTETWLLGAVVEQGPVRATDLAEWQGVDKSTITPQLRRLEERGLVTRRPDTVDRRAVLITASAQGHRALAEINAAGAAIFDAILEQWPARDRDALAALLSSFARQLPQQSAQHQRTRTS